jgi:hypothetical protein
MTKNRIMIDQSLTTQLQGLAVPVELVDESGRMLGHFVPRTATSDSDGCPYSAEELEAMRGESGGRPLAEIWRTLGAE